MASVSLGDRFGNLIAVAPVRQKSWLCWCDCGGELTTNESQLLNWKRISCGCLKGPNSILDIMGRLIVQENGCCLWPNAKAGGSEPHGSYGVVGYQGRLCYVHRLLYEHFVGPVPQGMVLDHFFCDTPACGNFTHVQPVTRGANVLRATGSPAVNARKIACDKGHLYEGDNLKILPNGWRKCRACERERDRNRPARRARQKAEEQR